MEGGEKANVMDARCSTGDDSVDRGSEGGMCAARTMSHPLARTILGPMAWALFCAARDARDTMRRDKAIAARRKRIVFDG